MILLTRSWVLRSICVFELSLFFFICGKLGHGESFCPFRLRIEPSKIIFGWDLSLRVVVGRRTLEVSKWLRETNGLQYFAEKLQKVAGEQHNWRKWGEDGLAINGFGKGPMDMVLEEENDVVVLVEGKKRQKVVEEPFDFLRSKEGSSSKHLSASSGDQSSRDQ
ncbi:hypothetical protein Goshw_012075 [Gossypium schwendimanii]|uniref:Uncharacterized protein n=1 Tax=Gossypium schwendimanii TaxID=34291 RepID=A0A7J9N6G1_GOSSC|nr:hypothetical protein [Gossypium schwendimanii]